MRLISSPPLFIYLFICVCCTVLLAGDRCRVVSVSHLCIAAAVVVGGFRGRDLERRSLFLQHVHR